MSCRREFLRSIAVGAVAWTGSGLAQATPTGRPRWGIAIDVRLCVGCQSCTVSCALENRVPEGQYRTHAWTWEVKDANGRIGQSPLPQLCNHCEQPPCVEVCPADATFRSPEGVVLIDNDRCLGCGACAQACPYGARYVNAEHGKVDKCNFCLHRVNAGLLPACVDSCVGGARVFGDLDDPHSAVSRLLAANKSQVHVLKPEAGTRPKVFYIGLDQALAAGQARPGLLTPAQA